MANAERGATATVPLLGIGEAAARAGVSERALRYYQQLGLITPSSVTPGGLRRYSEENLARVARIRELQSLLGFNLDEIRDVLDSEDRLAEIRRAVKEESLGDERRQELVRESLLLQQQLRATVQAKRQALDTFLADVDARISRMEEWLAGQR